MILIGNATEKFQIVLESAVTTAELAWTATFARGAASVFERFGPRTGVTAGTTPVDLLAGVDSIELTLKHLTVYNSDSVAAVVVLRKYVGGTISPVLRVVLDPLQTLTYVGGRFEVSPASTPVKTITLISPGIGISLTNSPLAERFCGNVSRHFQADLAGYKEVRMRGCVPTASASASSPFFRLRYYTSWSASFASFLQLGASAHVQWSLFTTPGAGARDTGWMDLAAGARVNGVWIAHCEGGGDGAIDPVVGWCEVMFR